MKTRRSWADVIQTLREHKCQPRQTLKSSPTKDKRWKTPTQGGRLHPRKNKNIKLLAANPKEESHTNLIPPLTTKITENNNHYS